MRMVYTKERERCVCEWALMGFSSFFFLAGKRERERERERVLVCVCFTNARGSDWEGGCVCMAATQERGKRWVERVGVCVWQRKAREREGMGVLQKRTRGGGPWPRGCWSKRTRERKRMGKVHAKCGAGSRRGPSRCKRGREGAWPPIDATGERGAWRGVMQKRGRGGGLAAAWLLGLHCLHYFLKKISNVTKGGGTLEIGPTLFACHARRARSFHHGHNYHGHYHPHHCGRSHRHRHHGHGFHARRWSLHL